MKYTNKDWIELFKRRLTYIDGKLYWTDGPKKSKEAGFVCDNGYIHVRISISYKVKKMFMSHRIIFSMINDYLPDIIDHIDRNNTNNRIENLREADKTLNSINRHPPCTNKSGFRGVSFNNNKWDSYIHTTIKGKPKKVHLGRYDNMEDAVKARSDGENEYWGKYIN